MKTYKCVKAWQRHGLGTEINEWEYTKLPINIKAGHFREIEYVGASTANTNIVSPPIPTGWTEGSKAIDLNVQLTDADKVTFPTTTSTEFTVATPPTNLQITNSAPLTTFSSGNKFKDKIRPSKNEDDIRPAE